MGKVAVNARVASVEDIKKVESSKQFEFDTEHLRLLDLQHPDEAR